MNCIFLYTLRTTLNRSVATVIVYWMVFPGPEAATRAQRTGAQLIDKLLMSLGWVEFELFSIVFNSPVERLIGRLIARGVDSLIKVNALLWCTRCIGVSVSKDYRHKLPLPLLLNVTYRPTCYLISDLFHIVDRTRNIYDFFFKKS